MSDVAAVLQVFQQDEIGDSRFEMASQSVQNNELLRISVENDEGAQVAFIRNVRMLKSPRLLWNVLTDVVAHAVMCTKIWSHARCDEVSRTVAIPFSANLTHAMVAFNFCHLMCLHELFADTVAHRGQDNEATCQSFCAPAC